VPKSKIASRAHYALEPAQGTKAIKKTQGNYEKRQLHLVKKNRTNSTSHSHSSSSSELPRRQCDVIWHVSSHSGEASCLLLYAVPFNRSRLQGKKVKADHTWLQSVGFWSWSRFLVVSLQVTWVINPAVGCHYFPPGLKLPPQNLRGLLPILLLSKQRHNGCEQFA